MGAAAWVWDCVGFAYAFGRGVAGGDGIAVSGAASAGAAGMGRVGVEDDGEQSAGSVLPDYGGGEEAAGFGSRSVAVDGGGDCGGDAG